LGVVNGTLYLKTDLGAPNKKIVAVAIDKPDAANWRTVVPDSKDVIESAAMVAGKIAVNRLVDVASDASFYNLDGSPAGKITPPGLGTIAGPVGRFDRQDVFYSFTSPLYPTTVFRFDPASATSTPFQAPKLTFDPSLYVTERKFAASKDGRASQSSLRTRKTWRRMVRTRRCCTATVGSTFPRYRDSVPR
jgi:Serine proteases of the peptidase family S9A